MEFTRKAVHSYFGTGCLHHASVAVKGCQGRKSQIAFVTLLQSVGQQVPVLFVSRACLEFVNVDPQGLCVVVSVVREEFRAVMNWLANPIHNHALILNGDYILVA